MLQRSCLLVATVDFRSLTTEDVRVPSRGDHCALHDTGQTSMDGKASDVRMGDEDAAEALPGSGDGEGGDDQAVRRERTDDPARGYGGAVGRRSGGRGVSQELASCAAASICVEYVDFYGRTMPAAQQLCSQACRAHVELSNRQGIPPYVTAPWKTAARTWPTIKRRVPLAYLMCVSGGVHVRPENTVCSCEFRGDCNYQIQSERTEYEEVVEEAMVMDEKEVCRCHAPELADRSCVRV